MPAENADGSWAELKALDMEINRLSQQKQNDEQRLKKLIAEEDPASGLVFAQEIHQLQLNKLRLETELEFCRKKMNRLLFLDQTGRSAK